MSQSTDGQICYGLLFPEGFIFPWMNEEDFDDTFDEDEWWTEVAGFTPTKEIFKKNGGRLSGVTCQEEDTYFEELRKWNDENPKPFQLVNYCSGDCPMYILAVPDSCIFNSRGYPEVFDPTNLKVTFEQEKKLLDFAEKYLKDAVEKYNSEEYNDDKIVLEPKWFLTSCWE